MIIFACVLITFGVFFYIFYIGEIEAGQEKDRLAYLAERKEVVYENLRDLNFEYKAGKLSDTDYSSLKHSLEAEAAAILAEMAQLEKMPPAARQKKGVRV
jgi:hypothetical protein